MIKFVTAWVDPNTGEVRGVTVCDMPLELAASPPVGLRPESVGMVTAKPGHDAFSLSPILKQYVTRGEDGKLSIDPAARAFVTNILHGPSTEDDIRAAETLNPATAWWLKKRLPPHVRWTPAIDQACAANPRLEAPVAQMYAKRFDPDGPLQPFAAFDRNARALKKDTP